MCIRPRVQRAHRSYRSVGYIEVMTKDNVTAVARDGSQKSIPTLNFRTGSTERTGSNVEAPIGLLSFAYY